MELGLGLWVAWLDASNAASVSINLEKNAIPKGESTIVKVEYHNGKLCPLLTNFVRTDVRRQRKLSRAEWRDTGRSDFEVDTNIERAVTVAARNLPSGRCAKGRGRRSEMNSSSPVWKEAFRSDLAATAGGGQTLTIR